MIAAARRPPPISGMIPDAVRRPHPIAALAVASLLLALMPAAGAGATPRPPRVQKPVPLMTGWQFHPDAANQGVAQHWETGGPTTGWTTISMPHVFDPRPLPELFNGTVGWYRLTFDGPATRAGFTWALRFEGVRRIAHVWFNGRDLGSNSDPYTPFEMRTRGFRIGKPNTVVVRVDNRKSAALREGWWNWGGIVRPVTLVPLGKVRIRELGVLPRLPCLTCRAQVDIEAVLQNRTLHRETMRVSVWMRSPAGVITRRTLDAPNLPRLGRRRLRLTVPVNGRPELWAPGAPKLYSVVITARSGNEVQQETRLRVGIRQIRVKHGTLYVNGKRVKLVGAAIQEDVEGHGSALTPADDDEIVRELKAAGATVTRAHYLLNDRLLKALDEAGIMVWNQAPIYHRDVELATAPGRQKALATLRGTVLAARNHASVLTHSVSNEPTPTPDIVPGTRAYLRAAAALVRRLDPDIPPSVDILSYPGYARQKTYDLFPLIGINNYFGWYAGKKDHSVADFNGLEPYLRSMRAKYPKVAFVMTEFGAESYVDGPATERGTYAFQSDYIDRTVAVADRVGFLGGWIYWTLREFAVKPDWIGGATATPGEVLDSIHNKGVITYAGKPKPAFKTLETLLKRDARD